VTGADPPLIELIGVRKNYAGLRPLRLERLIVGSRDRLALTGFDREAAEAFVHLVTGASLPDEGDVRIDGKDTREIATDTEWLASLDRFGIVTDRAVLVDKLPIASNLALPLTLTIDPMTAETRQQVERLANDAGLPVSRLDAAASTLTPDERVRVHLARSLAMNPSLLILEHPTGKLEDRAHSRAFGATLQAVAEKRAIGWIALTADEAFVRASGGASLRLNAATGELVEASGFWGRLLGKR
jgi:predicted ABC-type transport system involved in lysophospholipase L1 biosynthesis ATPase subunit